jgi:molecular chaperone GrpE (heat shock protein)
MTAALALFAVATGQDTQDARAMHGAIVRGWAAGPIGVMDELARLGVTPSSPHEWAELREEVAAMDKQAKQDEAHTDELYRELGDAEDTIENLRAEIENLRDELNATAAV